MVVASQDGKQVKVLSRAELADYDLGDREAGRGPRLTAWKGEDALAAALLAVTEEKARVECDRLNAQRPDMQVHYTVEPTHLEALLPQAAAKRAPIEAPAFSALATAPCFAANARVPRSA